MNLFPNQIKAVEYIIDRVVNEGKVLDAELKFQIDLNKKWGGRDRRNVSQAAYDIIRNYELLTYLSKDNDDNIISTYIKNEIHLATDFEEIKKDFPFDIQYSIPTDLMNIAKSENKDAEANLKAMAQIGNIYLRVNISLSSLNDFEKNLAKHEIEYTRIDSIKVDDKEVKLNCIQLKNRLSSQSEFVKKHDHQFEFQDLGSQILTELIDLKNAATIVESCAGNGGKTCHILDKTYQTEPLHLCFDSERKKVENLTLRVAKFKKNKVVASLAKEKEVDKYLNIANILFMDVPCTGSGTLKRQADLKYRITQEVLDEKVATQREIFHLFDRTLRKGGQLVYTTCSIFHSENQAQVDYFLTQGYSLSFAHHIEPKDYPSDGFFIACLTKN